MIPDTNIDLYLATHPVFDGMAVIIGLVLVFLILLYMVWVQPSNPFRQPPPKPKTKQQIVESNDDYKMAA